ncbi:MAG: DsrE family protein [Desulfobulbaceae bacterium]|jgi:intracellular sulfur oxidation DsrE/DsrF family protein|nr:DsrE family protein [Desulfobulbaceae bacterium]MDH3783604.1 DsrE family protein [Desulfobulbaceae bacterium]
MKQFNKSLPLKYMTILIMSLLMALHVSSSVAGEYDNALKDVKGIDVVFDVSAGNPAFANIVFWAVRDTYKNEAVSSLPEKSQVAVVFHGKVVKLLSSDRTGFDEKENAEIDKFQTTLREMAKEGVKLEVCLYAVKVLKIDPATILPEIDQVGNGFISVAGYQDQGYSVVRIP